MKKSVQIQLSFMMFLEFFIWGGWFVTLGTFMGSNLNASGAETAMAYSTQSWGAIVAPFFIGLIADKYFNAEKLLGFLHVLGAILKYMMYQASDFSNFYPYVLGYMIVYMPTLALVNSVSFNQMNDPAKQFSFIRVWGTIGWILAGVLISYYFHWDSQESVSSGLLKNTFLMTAVVSLFLGVFSFTLPKTPPSKNKKEKVTIAEILGLDALKLLTDRNFLVFFLSSVLICIPLAFYYQNANPFLSEIAVDNPTGKMTIGQASEVLFMLLLPFFFKKFGFNAVPVSETDILTSLQTGMINSMQTVPILSLSSGWSALMPNMLDLKWGAFVGAVIVDERVWKKIKPEHQKIMMEIANIIGKKYQKTPNNENLKGEWYKNQY